MNIFSNDSPTESIPITDFPVLPKGYIHGLHDDVRDSSFWLLRWVICSKPGAFFSSKLVVPKGNDLLFAIQTIARLVVCIG